MKVFLSWSGEKSKAAAEVFRRWLPCVLQSVRPWMSDRDIGAGARWGLEVGRALEETKFGILFVTDTNFSAPWLLFEAGALAKTLDEAFVCPYLVGLEPETIPAGPLTQFQAKRAVKGGTLDLVTTLNRALGDQALSEETLQTIFEKFWPDLDTALLALPGGTAPPTRSRTQVEMVGEILSLVRELAKREQNSLDEVRELAKREAHRNSGEHNMSHIRDLYDSMLSAYGQAGAFGEGEFEGILERSVGERERALLLAYDQGRRLAKVARGKTLIG